MNIFKIAYGEGASNFKETNKVEQIDIPYKCSKCTTINYFRPKQTETGLKCPLGHEFSDMLNRESNSVKDRIEKIEMCYFCKNYGTVMFADKHCSINSC